MAEKRAEKKKPSCLRRLAGCSALGLGCLGIIAAGGLVLAGAGGAGAWWSYQEYVVDNPGEHLRADNIRAVIAQESPVYYRDGTTRLGVFFEDEHRQTLSWEELPPAWVISIVAAEDGDYWTHPGISPRGISRAMVSNLMAGSVVAGGSTLTQQTAKNLFKRPDRSLRSKGLEFLNALRLEAYYDKTEILTFYANQFHVQGNGRGLGIAARYFFSKDVSELSVLECAFLAGLVKAPTYYDPFRGDEATQERNRQRGHDRVSYVLRRLAEVEPTHVAGPLALAEVQAVQEEARRLIAEGYELDFERGTFRYDSNAILDEVSRRLAEPPFDAVMAAAGIEDPATAGLEVITTLDPDAQREATYGLWHHLTEAGTLLEGLTAADFLLEDASPRHDPTRPLARHTFRLARITASSTEGLELDAGGHPCRVDRDGLVRVSTAIHRGQVKSRSAKPRRSVTDALAEQLPVDGVVLASVREVTEAGAVCDLEVRPELQGALVAVQDGQIRAMVAGNDNRNLNRAEALRQLGSTWKPLVYHAAMDLGWRPTDRLWNGRTAFPWQGGLYAPKPDHEPEPWVSMSWAGVRSENVASVWLLYHLTDRLDLGAARGLAMSLDLLPRPSEDDKTWHARLSALGISPSTPEVREAHWREARHRVLRRIQGTDHAEDALYLLHLDYGVAKASPDLPTWPELVQRKEDCEAQYDTLHEAWQEASLPHRSQISELWFRYEEGDEAIAVACASEAPDETWVEPSLTLFEEIEVEREREVQETVTEPETRRGLFGRRQGGGRRIVTRTQRFTESELEAPPLQGSGELWIDGLVHLRTVEALAQAEDTVHEQRQGSDPWDPQILLWTREMRLMLGIRYVAELGRRYGIRTEVPEVLSLPLGATEITIEEQALVYGGITTGTAWSFPGTARPPTKDAMEAEVESPVAPGLLILAIRDVDGHLIYEANPKQRPVTSPSVGAMTADILSNIVLHGTGGRARGAVRQQRAAVPLGGKTGTTNGFRNAAWVGFAPAWGQGGYSVPQGWVAAAYVGYDDNRPLKTGRTALSGASGALPAWVIAVQGFYEAGLLGTPDQRGSGTWPLVVGEELGLQRVLAEPARGLVVLGEDGQPTPATWGDAQSILTSPEEAVPAMLLPQEHRLRPGLRPGQGPAGGPRPGLWR